MNPFNSPGNRWSACLRLWLGLLTVGLGGPRLAAAGAAAPATTPSFQDFKIVFERNIFDPNRRPRSPREGQANGPPPVKTEGFSLIGTLISEQGAYAFFDGTDAKYRTALRLSNNIAGFKLIDISPNCVKLNSASNTIDLAMSMQMKRQDEGAWQLVAGAASWGTTNAVSAMKEPAAGGDAGDEAGADEIVKRLMQKREQELNK